MSQQAEGQDAPSGSLGGVVRVIAAAVVLVAWLQCSRFGATRRAYRAVRPALDDFIIVQGRARQAYRAGSSTGVMWRTSFWARRISVSSALRPR